VICVFPGMHPFICFIYWHKLFITFPYYFAQLVLKFSKCILSPGCEGKLHIFGYFSSQNRFTCLLFNYMWFMEVILSRSQNHFKVPF
jgi:hypothetical protein